MNNHRKLLAEDADAAHHHEWTYADGAYPRSCRHCGKMESQIPRQAREECPVLATQDGGRVELCGMRVSGGAAETPVWGAVYYPSSGHPLTGEPMAQISAARVVQLADDLAHIERYCRVQAAAGSEDAALWAQLAQITRDAIEGRPHATRTKP